MNIDKSIRPAVAIYDTQFVSDELPLGSKVMLNADTSWGRAGELCRVRAICVSGGVVGVDLVGLVSGEYAGWAPVSKIELCS